jgi:hypothetical protein
MNVEEGEQNHRAGMAAELDDPQKPEFASWRSFWNFSERVRHQRRYVWDAHIKAFTSTVLATVKDRDITLQKGIVLYRAQAGVEWISQKDDDGNELGEEPVGHGRTRMKPRASRAVEGRANPAGVPVLYLGTTEETAISEIRPWIGAEVSLAQFQLARNLRAIDLSRGHGKWSFVEIGFGELLGGNTPNATAKEKAVWIDIDNAFSRPVTLSDDAADYVPTQILAELFRNVGYDAIIYKSQFGEKGYNVSLFELDAADPVNCVPCRVTELKLKWKEIGNRWFSTKGEG